MTYGNSYPVSVALPTGTQLGYFTLDAARASTHSASDPAQRLADLPFTIDGSGQVQVTVPDDRSLLVPGWYKLTANTTDRVPSKSVWVQIR